jgi:hypothetical protein
VVEEGFAEDEGAEFLRTLVVIDGRRVISRMGQEAEPWKIGGREPGRILAK